jgi:hypothetical protein
MGGAGLNGCVKDALAAIAVAPIVAAETAHAWSLPPAAKLIALRSRYET